MPLRLEFKFDQNSYRHYLNGFLVVMHCHHYMTLLTKVAEEFDELGGTRILKESAEDAVRPMFDDYCEKHNIVNPSDRLNVGKEYYSVMGMGVMEVKGKYNGGEVTLARSHVDQGWIQKYGKREKVLNYWTSGYISAIFGSAFNKPPRSYESIELEGIVQGKETSKFLVRIK